jgi:NAD(P)H dehydrogenase (quinone)
MSAKKILIINGHPDAESFNTALVEAYKTGALASGAEVKVIHIRALQFNVNLQYGYRKRTELEPDLIDAQAKIKWAEHLVWVFPVWWGGYPAIMKGFIDRVFLPGFAFQKRENSLWWDKYLTGKTARIICTLDQPAWYYWLINRRPSYHALKRQTLEFCGISPVRVSSIGPIRFSKDSYRANWLKKIEKVGFENK